MLHASVQSPTCHAGGYSMNGYGFVCDIQSGEFRSVLYEPCAGTECFSSPEATGRQRLEPLFGRVPSDDAGNNGAGKIAIPRRATIASASKQEAISSDWTAKGSSNWAFVIWRPDHQSHLLTLLSHDALSWTLARVLLRFHPPVALTPSYFRFGTIDRLLPQDWSNIISRGVLVA